MTGLASLLFLAASVLIPAGRPSPPLVARTMAGKVWRAELKGQVTVVEFFATWCPHCRKSLAGSRSLLAGRNMRLIVVDVDEDPAAVRSYFGRNPLPRGAGLLIDLEQHARRTWGVKDFPTVYVIDARGVIRDSFSGWDDAGGTRYLAREIDAIMPAKAASPRRQKARKAVRPR